MAESRTAPHVEDAAACLHASACPKFVSQGCTTLICNLVPALPRHDTLLAISVVPKPNTYLLYKVSRYHTRRAQQLYSASAQAGEPHL